MEEMKGMTWMKTRRMKEEMEEPRERLKKTEEEEDEDKEEDETPASTRKNGKKGKKAKKAKKAKKEEQQEEQQEEEVKDEETKKRRSKRKVKKAKTVKKTEPEPKAKAKGKAKAEPKAQPNPKSLLRDKVKSMKIKELWDTLPEAVQKGINAMGRDERTEWTNKAVVRAGRKLFLDQTMVTEVLNRIKELRNKFSNKGLIIEEATVRCGGREGLLTALKEGRVLRQEVGGVELFFFPQMTFSKADGLKFSIGGKREKAIDNDDWQACLDTGLGFNQGIMDDSDVGLGSGGASSFQQVALPPPAAQPLLPLPPASITEDMEKEIRALHVSLSRQNNAGFALVEKTKSEKLPKLEGAAVVLVEDLVSKVEAELIDSEDKITLLNLAIKFKRISKEGEHNATNFLELMQDAKGTLERLGFAIRTLKSCWACVSSTRVHDSPTSMTNFEWKIGK